MDVFHFNISRIELKSLKDFWVKFFFVKGTTLCQTPLQKKLIKLYKFLFSFSVPPHQILVYDASGRDVAGAVGPLLEDDSLVLTCEVRGGE